MRGAAFLTAAAALAPTAFGQTIVYTKNGAVQGKIDQGVRVFQSVPFAEPPIGNLRFAPPVPHANWDGVKDVTALPNPCPQLKLFGGILVGNEDCLQLSVFVPENAGPGPLPVLNWFYGGAYVLGDAWEAGMYDGYNLAKRTGAVVVTSNYRLGPLGFMALDELMAEDGTAGNAALLDQVAVLQWVQANIAAFGGDPNSVTIFGESAGAFSVAWHLVSPASAGLFHRAILESGTFDAPQFFQPLSEAIAFNSLYAEAVGCPASGGSSSQLSCLRALPSHTVLEALLDFLNPNWPFMNATGPASAAGSGRAAVAAHFQKLGFAPSSPLAQLPALSPLMPWGPAIDGKALLDVPLALLQAGKFNKVPVIMGTNKDEGSIFIPVFPFISKGMSFPPKQSDLPGVVEHAFNMFPAPTVANLTRALIEPMYSGAMYGNNTWQEGTDMLTHAFFACATRRGLRAIAAAGVPVWRYEFTQHLRFIEDELLPLGDFHASELAFVWRNDCALLQCFNADEQQVADAFNAYWGNFAHSSDPNVGNLTTPVQWPRMDAQAGVELSVGLRVPFSVNTDIYEYQCDDAWDPFYYGLTGAPRTKWADRLAAFRAAAALQRAAAADAVTA